MISRRSAVAAAFFTGSALAGTAGVARALGAGRLSDGLGPVPTIPAVRSFASADRAWRPSPATRIVLDPETGGALRGEARLLAEELVQEGHLPRRPQIVASRHAKSSDLFLRLGRVTGSRSPEAYTLTPGRALEITGRTAAGAFCGTRTVLQILRQRGVVDTQVTDWPSYPQRGLMVDVGRKYFGVEWLENRIRELSWLKLNVLHLHLSDGQGFRIESESHPELVSEPALTKDEMRKLLALAERHHVVIVPEIDSPAHMDAILSVHPQLQLVRADGTRDRGNLDYSKPEARALVTDLVREYAELFPGPWFHLGGDEYFGYPWDPNKITERNAPQLLAYARATAGPEATLLDGFKQYMNSLIAVLAARGKRAKMWNDHIVPGEGRVEIDRRAEVEVWIRWNTEEPSVEDYVRAGFDVVNAHGDHLYFILAEGQQHETGKKSAQGVYELWQPRSFMYQPTEDLALAEDAPMSGAHLSIWCDNPGFQTEQEVADGIRPWLRSFAQQLWGTPKPAPAYTGFVPLITAVGDAPGAVDPR